MNKRLLLLSNSTNPGEPYLGWPEKYIRNFLGKSVRKALFIPYAGVTITFDTYFQTVSKRFAEMGYQVDSIHLIETPSGFLAKYDAILVGGGNTFQLLHLLQKNKYLEPIRQAVESGMPYIGWSAGSNMACPTIKTTNDMPIVQPESFKALGLVPFQINPHYTEATIPNHGGESRDIRIREFVTVNQEVTVAGLPEGSLLRVEISKVFFEGKGICTIFRHNQTPQSFDSGSDLSWLLK